MDDKLIVLFSGRFDRPHIGHFITIAKLGQQYGKVLVPVLDYKGQHYPITYRVSVLAEALSYCNGNFEVFKNEHHFGKITKDEVKEYKFDVYASGNWQCIENMKNLGFKTIYTPRSYDYSASNEYLKK
jgi:phosphopantetheine adenylyltransferase